MNQTRKLVVFIFCLTAFAQSALAAPERTRGISVHMLPKRVADLGGQKWGLSVDYADYLKPERQQPVLQTAKEFLTFVRKQDARVQGNGVWIVVTNPDAYADSEKTLLEVVESVCRKERIPLFICRASELPNGWKRYDQP